MRVAGSQRGAVPCTVRRVRCWLHVIKLTDSCISATQKTAASNEPKASSKLVKAAFQSHFRPPTGDDGATTGNGLLEMLRTLPALSVEEHVDLVHVQIQKHYSGVSFSPDDYAMIAFIDAAITEILKQIDVDYHIESYIRDITPIIAADAVADGLPAVTSAGDLLSLIDLILKLFVSWSEDLGELAEVLMESMDLIIGQLVNRREDAATTCVP
jgi:hypothetical protein